MGCAVEEKPVSRMSKRAKRKAKHQAARRRQSIDRENAQLAGEIPTTPVGALRPEAVDPQSQEEPVGPLPKLIVQAARNGWATPEEKKPGYVDLLDTIAHNHSQPAKIKIAAINALRQLDQMQHERDNPKETKSTGPTEININVMTIDGPQQESPQLIEVSVVESNHQQDSESLPQARAISSQ